MGATNHRSHIHASQQSCVTISSIAGNPLSLLSDLKLSSPRVPSTRHAFPGGQLLQAAASGSLRTCGVLPMFRASLVNQLQDCSIPSYDCSGHLRYLHVQSCFCQMACLTQAMLSIALYCIPCHLSFCPFFWHRGCASFRCMSNWPGHSYDMSSGIKPVLSCKISAQ